MELYGNQIHCFDEIDLLTVDFIVNKNEKPIFNKLENIGYVFYGPLVFYFMVWLMNNLYQNDTDKVFFNSREGYFLLKLYNLMKTITDSNDLPEGIYFKTSRRMATVPAIFNENDIYETLKLKGDDEIHRFNGSFESLLVNRFGVVVDDDDKNKNKIVDTRVDIEKVFNYLEHYKNRILKNSTEERNNYLTYLNSICKGNDKIIMVDNGTHGTAQAHIEKIMNRKFIGNYFCVDKSNLYNLDVSSFYSHDTNHIKNVFIFLESVLTGPLGTYIKCDKNGKFTNDKPKNNQLIFDKKIEIFNGIKLFTIHMIDSIFSVRGLKLNNNLPDFIFSLLESDDIVIKDDIQKTFYFDNQFVQDTEKMIYKEKN
jgi:hypothetical protein